MPLIPEHVIDEVQARIDIAELIGRYVPLKRAGRHFKANCPFHQERTPSFMVNTDKQVFHCFGCGVGGNVFSFLMQHDRLTFPEAVRQLAEHTGIAIPDAGSGAGNGAHEALLVLQEKACQYFERRLSDPRGGKAARAYLASRGVSEHSRQAFRLGLAPAGWNQLLSAARTTGLTLEQLEAGGLVIRGPRRAYDRFRNRLMFPIMDVRRRVLGFGGRSLEGQEPKYLNSPETAVYSKGRHLYGLAQARDAVVERKAAVVVEGYFDCVVLADAGVAHVVSPLGTALTAEQAKLLKRYAQTVMLAFDADAAGEQATLRGIDLLVEAGLAVRVAQLPQGVDPDEYVRTYGRERFDQLLSRSLTIFEALVEAALRRFPAATTEGKVSAAQFVLPTIARVPDAMLRREYVRMLAERLRLDEAAVAEELAKVQPRSASLGEAPAPKAASAPAVAQGLERLLVALVLDDPARLLEAQPPVRVEDVGDPHLRRILAVVCELAASGRPVSPAHVVSRLSGEGEGPLVSALVELAHSIPAKAEAFADGVRRLAAQARRRQLANLRDQIRAAQDAGHDQEVQRLLTVYQQELSTAGA